MSLLQGIDFCRSLAEYLSRFYLLDEKTLQAFRNRQFESVIKYARANIPFYQKRLFTYKAGLNKVEPLGQIRHLPLTEPGDIFSQAYDAISGIENRYITLRSSGTTGRPKDVHLSHLDWLYFRKLAYLRMFFTSGCSALDKTLFLTSPQFCLPARQRWFQRLGLMRSSTVSILEPQPEQAGIFNTYQPDVFYCLAADGASLAHFISLHNRYRHKAKYIFTTGELLTQRDRQVMADSLGGKIIDFYANTEMGIIAWQCAETGEYHINADQVYVEILDGETECPEEETGEIVLTSLIPASFPFIRYRTGDMASIRRGRCRCGSSFPRLSRILGRSNDFLTDTGGNRISPYALMATMDGFKDVLMYKMHQKAEGEYVIYLKLSKGAETGIVKENIRKAYSGIFGAASRISLADLPDLPVSDNNNEHKTVQSFVKNDEI